MKLLPDNIKPDKYLGKGIEYLWFALVFICIILILTLIGIFTKSLNLGELGSFLGGALGPIVALLVAIFTYLAFYVQYDANKKIQEQFRTQQFESQFYKMLDLHKSNIEEMKISFFDHLTEEDFIKDSEGKLFTSNELRSTEFLRSVEGRKLFPGMLLELETIISVVIDEAQKKLSLDIKRHNNIYEHLLHYSYRLFFFGLGSEQVSIRSKLNVESEVTEKLLGIQKKFYERHKLGVYNRQSPNQFKFYPFEGHESRLSHYYRNIFAIVKLVVQNYDDDYGTNNYLIGRNYLKILRAQLSNAEQHLLYYNYRIGFGKEWDKLGNRGNKYLTKYRMIHNLHVDRIRTPESPREHFHEYINSVEVNRKDPLFEWGD